MEIGISARSGKGTFVSESRYVAMSSGIAVKIKETLEGALNFLSGDEISFEFTKATQPAAIEPFLGFRDGSAQTIRPDKVMLFSGGLDSLVGVAEDVIGRGQRAVLVAHQSANITANHQNLLAKAIGERTAKNQTFYAPIWVRRGEKEPIEHTQRLRSFLFASLGMAYAHMFGQNSLYYYENGAVEPFIGDALRYLGITPEGKRWIATLYGNVFMAEHHRLTSGPQLTD